MIHTTVHHLGYRACLYAAFMITFASLSLIEIHAQNITADPNAKPLRRIWTMLGSREYDQLGAGIGAIPDINGDSIGEFAVRTGSIGRWNIYLGGKPAPSTTPFWWFDSSSAYPQHPIVGRFWGDSTMLAMPTEQVDTTGGRTKYFYQLHFFRVENHQIVPVPSIMLDPHRTMADHPEIGIADVLTADLDGDGADELILVLSGLRRNDSTWHDQAEIWIYRGGPNFQVDTPSVIIRDTEGNGDASYVRMYIQDFDGDQHPDLLLAAPYAGGAKLKFWWGSANSPSSWNEPERIIQLDATTPQLGTGITIVDCNGDHLPDVVMPRGNDTACIFLSGPNQSLRDRSLRIDDADAIFSAPRAGIATSLGYLNDKAHRYEMMGLFGLAPSGQSSVLLGFSGGPDGPNHQYDATYSPEADGLGTDNVFAYRLPVGDCSGDGWGDFLCGGPAWGGVAGGGIAVILAGGPEIPHDFAGIRTLADAERSDAVTLWPNPVIDQLHIAWRGDLRSMPSRFLVHDALGRQVASGSVDPTRGAALWNCAGQPAGLYLLSIFDADGTIIATAGVNKL